MLIPKNRCPTVSADFTMHAFFETRAALKFHCHFCFIVSELQQFFHDSSTDILMQNCSFEIFEKCNFDIEKFFCKVQVLYTNRDILNVRNKCILFDTISLSHSNYGDVAEGPDLNDQDE